MSRVRPKLAKNGWVLHHDNAPAQFGEGFGTVKKILKKKIVLL